MRRALAPGAAALLIFALPWAALGQGIPGRELQMIQNGRGRAASVAIKRQLQLKPGDQRLHTLLGLAEAAEGRWADALPEFDDADGAELYWSDGMREHASGLRATGQPEQAATLYRELLLSPAPGAPDSVYMWMNLSDAWREAGDPVKAEDALVHALGMRPDALKPNAMLAELALDQGDWQHGEDILAQASARKQGYVPPRFHHVQVRLLLAQGALPEAEQVLETARQDQRWDPRLVGLQVQLDLQLGNPQDALTLLDRPNIKHRQDPVLLAARARTLRALGQDAEADWVQSRLESLAPGYPLNPEAVPGLTPG